MILCTYTFWQGEKFDTSYLPKADFIGIIGKNNPEMEIFLIEFSEAIQLFPQCFIKMPGHLTYYKCQNVPSLEELKKIDHEKIYKSLPVDMATFLKNESLCFEF